LDLTLVRRKIDTILPEFLAKYRRGNIKIVKLEKCYKLNNEMLDKMCSAFSATLQVLNIKECGGVKSLESINQCTILEQLNISDCKNIPLDSMVKCLPVSLKDLFLCKLSISQPQLESIAKQCKNLEVLVLEECSGITDAAVQSVVTNCPQLRTLNLSWCSNITDKGIETIATNCPELRVLEVNQCYALTDKAVQSVAKHCTKLLKLFMEECFLLTPQSLKYLRDSPNLKILSILNCQNITKDSVSDFLAKLPNCRVISSFK